jgi:hypothetical protein
MKSFGEYARHFNPEIAIGYKKGVQQSVTAMQSSGCTLTPLQAH